MASEAALHVELRYAVRQLLKSPWFTLVAIAGLGLGIGANVALFTPFDDVVFERTSVKKGIAVAALSQIAVDLMTSPGRGPNEAEALMQWMQENEDAWRA